MTKTNIGRGIFALIAIFFIGNGLMVMLSPTNIIGHMLLGEVKSVSGLSSIRALLGATILAVWSSVLLGAIKSNVNYVLVGILCLSAVIFARLVGYFADGGFPEFTAMIVPPMIALALLLIAYKLMASSENELT